MTKKQEERTRQGDYFYTKWIDVPEEVVIGFLRSVDSELSAKPKLISVQHAPLKSYLRFILEYRLDKTAHGKEQKKIADARTNFYRTEVAPVIWLRSRRSPAPGLISRKDLLFIKVRKVTIPVKANRKKKP